MRFLIVSLADLGASSGEAVTSARLARSIAEFGHEVELLAPAAAGTRCALELGAARECRSPDVTRLGLPNSLNSLPQILHVLRRLLAREVDVVYVRAAALTFLFGLCGRLFSGVTVVSEQHGWMAAERRLRGRLAWLAPLEASLQVLDARCAHRVRTVVPGIKQRLVARGIAPGRVLVVGNACDTDSIRPLPRVPAVVARGLVDDRRYLGFLGSLSPWQGLDVVVRGFADVAATHADVDLLLAGDGPCRAALETQARALGLAGRVHFLGRVPHAAVAAVMACFDVALMPTHSGAYVEIGRSPLKLREYAAAGRRILAARVEALEALEAEPWVSFYAAGDSAEFAARALGLLARPADAGRAARAYAETHFAWPVITRQILEGLGLAVAPGATGAPLRCARAGDAR